MVPVSPPFLCETRPSCVLQMARNKRKKKNKSLASSSSTLVAPQSSNTAGSTARDNRRACPADAAAAAVDIFTRVPYAPMKMVRTAEAMALTAAAALAAGDVGRARSAAEASVACADEASRRECGNTLDAAVAVLVAAVAAHTRYTAGDYGGVAAAAARVDTVDPAERKDDTRHVLCSIIVR